MSSKYSEKQYKRAFRRKEDKALKEALDIRKFEIELYWKRAGYFWAFIAAIFAGYFAVLSADEKDQNALLILSCLGMVFSFAWYNVNRGSKFWQENWESHVDKLEDSQIGPLYKVVFNKKNDNDVCIITNKKAMSVSKINQIVSLYVFIIWVCIWFKQILPINFTLEPDVFKIIVSVFSHSACILIYTIGQSSAEYDNEINKRDKKAT